MLGLTIAASNLFNTKKQGKLAPICDQLLLTPAHKLSKSIKDGHLSSVRLCQAFIERIKQVQPLINCVCQDRFMLALDEARRIDELLEQVRARPDLELNERDRDMIQSPLLGVPISIKESIKVTGMRNTCGLWDRRQVTADEDAVVVKNVRRFGMIPICTTNVPECTLFWADCQNRVYGRSVNPYDLARITGASSGGEGGLLGAAGSVIGIGSDIGGSLRIPAHYCGIYSHKPSPFLLSAEGNFPHVKAARLRMFSLGPMCRYASDLRPLLKCLMQDYENTHQDTYFKHQPADIGACRTRLIAQLDEPIDLTRVKIFYFDFNTKSELKGKQSIHVNDELMQGQRDVVNHFVARFNCQSEHISLDKYLKRALITWQCLLRCGGEQDRADAYEDDELKQTFGITSVALEFLKMPLGLSKHTKESLLTLIVGSAVPSERSKAFELCEKFEQIACELKREMFDMLTDNGVLIMPTMPTVAYKHNVPLLKTPDLRFPSMFNVLQLPVTHATVRLDHAHGLPFGVSIAARPYNDHLTLAVAEEIENAFGGWTPPGRVNVPANALDTSVVDEQQVVKVKPSQETNLQTAAAAAEDKNV